MVIRKTLQQWYNQGEFNSEKKNVMNKFGVSDNYPEYASWDLWKLWYLDEIYRRKKPNVYGRIQKMIFFSTWWNNNLAVVINGEGSYGVYAIIYEMPWKNMSEVLETKWIDSGLDWSDAKSKAYNVEGKLKGDNPILYKSPSLELEYSSNYRFRDVQIDTLYSPSSVESSPDSYLKPLDIIRKYWWNSQKNREELHAAVYLGNGKICHAVPTKAGSYGGYSYSYANSDYYGGCYASGGGKIEIIDLGTYLTRFGKTTRITRNHPLVPYKHKDKVISNLAEGVEGDERYYSKRGEFDIATNNCEQFSNLAVHGVDISELVEKKKVDKRSPEAQRTKPYNIESKVSSSNSFFNGLTSSYQRSRINQIEDYTKSGAVGKGVMYEGIKLDSRIEVEPKSWYRIN